RMVLIQGVFAAVMRSLGRILNMAFGWATVLLFGQVPQNRQVYVNIMAFGSVAWLIAALGIAFPAFGAWVLTFATLPKWVDKSWIRIAMLVLTVILPLILGFVSLKALEPQDRPKDAGGYWKR